jgi:transposase InsO family protein
MAHGNALLTEKGRLRLARCVVDDGWALRRAAERFQVSATTAKRWADRYRTEGPAGMADRSSRPRRSPRRTRPPVVRKILHLRRTRGWGPARIGPKLGVPVSTVGSVLRRERVPPLGSVDLATRQQLRRTVHRYEHDHPGDLVHVDIKKLGRIPDGGGWRTQGRRQGARNGTLTRARGIARGYGYVHTAIDDHSRLAYSEVLHNETAVTAAGFWHRAHAFFAAAGITVTAVLTDNGSCYRSREWAQALAATGITHRRTRPYRPQTNGKVERFNRTLLTEWAYAKPYRSESARRAALAPWLHLYNHHRHHTAIGGPPAHRVTNLSGQYT